MCGISGYITKNEYNEELITKMTDKINYRGPNSFGYNQEVCSDKTYLALGHRRLAIVDLSELGHQPMEDEQKSLIIVFNGEVYNFKELKSELIERGWLFKSQTDTEVIMYAYKQWGKRCFEKFNGMFAIAIFDRMNQELILSRDRLGVKPLYYYINDDSFVFGSELKCIMEYPEFEKKINIDAVSEFIANSFISGEKTIFQNTYKLLPGCLVSIKNFRVEAEAYWNIEEVLKKQSVDSYSEYKSCVHNLLKDAIGKRMISDVPIGAFLSGGVDSSLIVALMQEQSKVPVNTFSIGFDEEKYNEANYAKKIAAHLGTQHTELYLSIDDAKQYIKKISKFYDEPFADSSQLPMMMVSQLASQFVTVVLSGDGGDELFCGYEHYVNSLKYQKYKPVAKIMNCAFKKFKLEKRILSWNRKIFKLSLMNSDNSIINADYLYSKYYIEKLIKNKYKYNERYFIANNMEKNIQKKNMIKDILTYLPDDILTKVDRASMAYSIEARTPILDYRIVEIALQSKLEYNYENNVTKRVLRDILYEYVPKEMIERPKQGFSIPVNKWIHEDLKEDIKKYFSKAFLDKQQIFDTNGLIELYELFLQIKDPYLDKLVWNIYVFQMWWEEYLKDEEKLYV